MSRAPSPLDQRLVQLLIARGLPGERARALEAQGQARGVEHRGSLLLGGALAAGQLTLAQADELLAAVEGALEIEAPAQAEIPPLERSVGQVLVHRGLLTPVRLAELFARAAARGQRHGGSLLAAEAIAEGLLSRATADLLLRSLGPQAPADDRPGAGAAEADALIAKALGGQARPDANPADADDLIRRALDETVARPGPNAPRQAVRLSPPRPGAGSGRLAAQPPALAAPPLAAGPASLPGGFGEGPGGFGLSPAPGGGDAGGDATVIEPPPAGADRTRWEPASPQPGPSAATTMHPLGAATARGPLGDATSLEPLGDATTMDPLGSPPGDATSRDPWEAGDPQPAGDRQEAGGATLAGLPSLDEVAAPATPDATHWEPPPRLPVAGGGQDTHWNAPPGPAAPPPDATLWERTADLPPSGVHSGLREGAATQWEPPPSAPASPEPATEAGKPAPAAVRRGRVSATARLGSPDFLEEVFGGERYQLLPGPGAPGRQAALDRRLRREVILHTPPGQVRGAGEAERFLRAAHLLAQLDHAAIPRVHDIGLRDGQPYYATDPLPGERLSELRGAGTAPRLPSLLRVFLRVAAAVDHAHQAGLVHGELGPERVVLGELGQVWVDGWGRACALPGAGEAIQAAARAARPEGEAPAHQAPEARAGRPLGPRTDVWGLGVVLLWIACRRHPGPRGEQVRELPSSLPGELAAILRRALSASPSGRYPHPRALLEDVRAFLDGGPVSAAPQGAWGTLRRLARRHPLPAGIAAGGLGALLLIGGLALRAVHADWARAREHAGAARTEQERAERLRELAGIRLEAARRRGAGELELAQARAETREATALARFAAAEEAARAAQAREQEADALEQQLEGKPPPRPVGAEHLAARARRLRGEWILRVAGDGRTPPPLDKALADWRALCQADPRDAEAQLGRYLAARRLPGASAAREEAAALAALAGLDGPLADLARAETALREAEAAVDAGSDGRDGASQALELAEGAIAARPDLALGFEVRGRARLLRSGRGPMDQRREGGLVVPGLSDLLHAARLDPHDPFARLGLLRHWNEAYGLHHHWRYEVREWVGELERASALTARLEPTLELAHYMQMQGLAASSLAGLERAARRLAPELRPGEELQRARLRVLQLRAALAAGGATAEVERALHPDLPPGLAAQAAMLRAHRALIEERGEAVQDALRGAFEALQAARGDPFVLQDLLALLADERADAGPALSLLGGGMQLPPPNTPAALGVAPIVSAVLHAGARAGVPLPQLQRFLEWLIGAGALEWDSPRADLFAPARLGHARVLLGLDPAAGDAGFFPLLVWASANHLMSTSPAQAREAQALLSERARKLNRPDLARAFEPHEPARSAMDEVWVRRAWEPAPEDGR